MAKRIVFTGGGTAGHVTVNLALIPIFIKEGWDVKYMGSEKGIEAELLKKFEHVEYIPISTGKLRRYMDLENIKDPFRVIKGVYQAYRQIKLIKPNIVFSKGGFVSVPVVIGAWLNRVPVVIHESDITPGLANKLSAPFCTKICVTFPETEKYMKASKVTHVGSIIRKELLQGNRSKGLSLCHFTRSKPVLVCMGGSQGSQRINEMLRKNLPHMLHQFQIVHICGKGQIDHSLKHRGYIQFEYVDHDLADILAMADVVISRAGSNSIFEFLALKKPMLLIPLSKQASRGDQILNARSFQTSGFCKVLLEEDMSEESFVDAVQDLYDHRHSIVENMNSNETKNALQKVVAIIHNSSI